MTSALSAAYDPTEHPHAPAGSATGGQFANVGSATKKAATDSAKAHSRPAARKRTSKPAPKAAPKAHDDGTLSYDPKTNRGTGYDDPDPRVHKLQEELVRHGFTDADGKPLKLDGKLGPKSTAAVKKAQRALGLPADGKATPAFLAALAKSKTPAAPPAKTPAPAGKLHKMAAAAATDLRDVELARPGLWNLSSGPVDFTPQMLQDAADFFSASGGQAVPVKLGHNDDRFDGEPTFGSVTNVRYTQDDRGPVLLGDIVDMPEWLGAAAPKRWPNRSIEGWQNFAYGGREYSLILSGLAFLGVTPPGVRNIKSLADLQVALAASSATRLVASAPSDDPADPPDGEEEEIEEDEDLDGDPPDEPESLPHDLTPALPAGVSHSPAEAAHNAPARGAGMNLAKYREALAGLPDDASEEDVKTALASAGFVPEPDADAVAASSAQERDQRLAANAKKSGVVTIDGATLAEFQEAQVQAKALYKRLEEQERDTVIVTAVRQGKFPPARKPHYERMWAADPTGTKELIESLSANLVPVHASGYDTDAAEDAALEAEFAGLWPPNGNKGGRRG